MTSGADIPEVQVTYLLRKATPRKTRAWTPMNVRPIQMGKLVRKYVSRRLLALREGEFAALMTAMRVAVLVHKEALRLWQSSISSSLTLARIAVDGKNCFGMIERHALRASFPSAQQKQTGSTELSLMWNKKE